MRGVSLLETRVGLSNEGGTQRRESGREPCPGTVDATWRCCDHPPPCSPPCPEGSQSYEWSCTAQEVRVHPPSFSVAGQLLILRFSHGIWIRAHEEYVSVDLRSPILSHHTRVPPATVPTPDQTYDALAPDLKKKVDAARAARLARENTTAEQLQAQASLP